MIPVWLSGAEFAVYVALRSFADRYGEARPHVRTIATRAGVSERTASRAIAVMRDKGLLRTDKVAR
jgi:DNA-binding transcriptional regulator YhcF (GntR family)